MKVKNEIRALKVNGIECVVGSNDTLIVTNTWNRRGIVTMRFNDESIIEVDATELRKAIENSTNTVD